MAYVNIRILISLVEKKTKFVQFIRQLKLSYTEVKNDSQIVVKTKAYFLPSYLTTGASPFLLRVIFVLGSRVIEQRLLIGQGEKRHVDSSSFGNDTSLFTLCRRVKQVT